MKSGIKWWVVLARCKEMLGESKGKYSYVQKETWLWNGIQQSMSAFIINPKMLEQDYNWLSLDAMLLIYRNQEFILTKGFH